MFNHSSCANFVHHNVLHRFPTTDECRRMNEFIHKSCAQYLSHKWIECVVNKTRYVLPIRDTLSRQPAVWLSVAYNKMMIHVFYQMLLECGLFKSLKGINLRYTKQHATHYYRYSREQMCGIVWIFRPYFYPNLIHNFNSLGIFWCHQGR